MVPIIVDFDPDDYTPMSNKVNKYIVIHYTGNFTDTARNNAKYFKNGKRWASAHYFVDPNEIVQIVRDKDASWGVGKKYGNAPLWGICTNANSINIEMCSTNGVIAEQTLKNTAELTKSLMQKYNIPIQNVVRHYDVCAKRCPGWNGWLPGNESIWNRFKQMVQGLVPSNPQPAPQPAPQNVDVYYRAFSNGRWWGEVKNCNDVNSDGYAGVDNKPTSCVMARVSQGSIRTRVKVLGKRNYYPWATGYNASDYYNGFAGDPGKPIDRIQFELVNCPGHHVMYRVSLVGSSGYLPWVTDLTDFAGIDGRQIDKIQVKIV